MNFIIFKLVKIVSVNCVLTPNRALFCRYHFAHTDQILCMYQGFIEAINAIQNDYDFSEIDDKGIFMIRAFQFLRRFGQRIPKKAIKDMFGNCVSLFYEIPSKLVVLAGVCQQ